MAAYNPRNRNLPTYDERKSTARWFDDRKRRDSQRPCGFEPWRWSNGVNRHGA